jgi:hypothetical protein
MAEIRVDGAGQFVRVAKQQAFQIVEAPLPFAQWRIRIAREGATLEREQILQ